MSQFKSGAITRRDLLRQLKEERLTPEDFKRAKADIVSQARAGLPILQTEYLKEGEIPRTVAQYNYEQQKKAEIEQYKKAEVANIQEQQRQAAIETNRQRLMVKQAAITQPKDTMSLPVKPLSRTMTTQDRFTRRQYPQVAYIADTSGKQQNLVLQINQERPKEYGDISPGFQTRIQKLIAREQEYKREDTLKKQRFGIKQTDYSWKDFISRPTNTLRNLPIDVVTNYKLLGGRIAFAAEATLTEPGRAYLSEPYLRKQALKNAAQSVDPRTFSGALNLGLSLSSINAFAQNRLAPKTRIAEIELAGDRNIRQQPFFSKGNSGDIGRMADFSKVVTRGRFSGIGEASGRIAGGESNLNVMIGGGRQKLMQQLQQQVLNEAAQSSMQQPKTIITIKEISSARIQPISTTLQGLFQGAGQIQQQRLVQTPILSQFQAGQTRQSQLQKQTLAAKIKQFSILKTNQAQTQQQRQNIIQALSQIQIQSQAQRQAQLQKTIALQQTKQDQQFRPPKLRLNIDLSQSIAPSPPKPTGLKQYKPTLEALFFNIRGAQPKTITPYSFRPITRVM